MTPGKKKKKHSPGGVGLGVERVQVKQKKKKKKLNLLFWLVESPSDLSPRRGSVICLRSSFVLSGVSSKSKQ